MFSEMFEQFWEANSLKIEITSLTQGEFVWQYYFIIKVNVKNERRFDRPTVIFKFRIRSKN